MTVDIKPLSDALGAEVIGVDFSQPVPKDDLDTIRTAFLDNHLLCLRGEPLTPESFAKVAGYFGEPQLQLKRSKRDTETPEVSILESTYQRPEDKPDDLSQVRLSGWHTDDSYFEIPAKATMLQALDMPESGGETRFCNTRKAYDDLDDAAKERFGKLKAVHCYDTMRAPARAEARTEIEKSDTPDVVHPMVRTHDETGRKALYFNPNRTDSVVGLDRAESDALLDGLYDHMTQRKYRYDHSWQVGDILLWDNRCLLHSVNTDFPVGQRRRHQRILLKGTRPV